MAQTEINHITYLQIVSAKFLHLCYKDIVDYDTLALQNLYVLLLIF